jgi:uncharacterized membrane protein YdbT with pleckstrin-like domain
MYHRGVMVWSLLVSVVFLTGYLGGRPEHRSIVGTLFWMGIFGWLPFLISYLKFKTTKYYVTNIRIYLSSGILSRNIREIPLSKVNDVAFSQGILERANQTGSVRILTGNDAGTIIKKIEKPEEFRECIASLIGNANHKAS